MLWLRNYLVLLLSPIPRWFPLIEAFWHDNHQSTITDWTWHEETDEHGHELFLISRKSIAVLLKKGKLYWRREGFWENRRSPWRNRWSRNCCNGRWRCRNHWNVINDIYILFFQSIFSGVFLATVYGRDVYFARDASYSCISAFYMWRSLLRVGFIDFDPRPTLLLFHPGLGPATAELKKRITKDNQ